MRQILHVDCNNFYASVECLYHPEIRNYPVVVAGDAANRHSVIMAKNLIAKKLGIQTGDVVWQARARVPNLVVMSPDYPKYIKYSRRCREIYREYTEQVEPFGLDECWLDLTGSLPMLKKDAVAVAEEIRRRVKYELGITVSIGVSYNKIFAKLGSDLKKPDAVTVIPKENFKEIVWNLPVSDLLYVGDRTASKLELIAVNTIGDLARLDIEIARRKFGKMGEILWAFANGYDSTPVRKVGEEAVIKSIGNGITCHRDLENEQDVKLVFQILAESVASRLRESGMKCKGVQIMLRGNDLSGFVRQHKVRLPMNTSEPLVDEAMDLLRRNWRWQRRLRSISLSGIYLVSADTEMQLSLFDDKAEKLLVQENLEKAVDWIRWRFGHGYIKRCSSMLDAKLTNFNPRDYDLIHPYSYFR